MADRTARREAKLLRLEQRAAQRKRIRKPGERTSRRLHRTYDQIAGLRAKAKRRAAGLAAPDDHRHRPHLRHGRGRSTHHHEHGQVRQGNHRGAGEERRPEVRAEPLHQPGGMGPHGHHAGVQDRPATAAPCTRSPPPAPPGAAPRAASPRPAAGSPRPCSCARTRTAAGRATPTTTRPGTSCTCTGWASRSSRLPGGQSSGARERVKPATAR